MPLVAYGSSGSENDSDAPRTKRSALMRKRSSTHVPPPNGPLSALPPVPPAFHDLYASAARVSTRDDPALHEGKQRAVPHIEGRWPAHIYLEWRPSQSERDTLETLIGAQAHIRTKLHSLLKSDLGSPLPLHISLSSPLSLETQQRESFLARLTAVIRGLPVSRIDQLSFEALDWVSNQNDTRWFLVLKVRKPADDSLNLLLRECNGIASSFGQPQLYEALTRSAPKTGHPKATGEQDIKDASRFFHFSIAWSLLAPQNCYDVRFAEHQQLPECAQSMRASCESVKVKIGNTITSIMLRNSQDASNSILA